MVKSAVQKRIGLKLYILILKKVVLLVTSLNIFQRMLIAPILVKIYTVILQNLRCQHRCLVYNLNIRQFQQISEPSVTV